MIRSLLYQPDTGELTEGGVELLERWRSDASLHIWLDLYGESAQNERRLMRDDFALHPLAIADAQRHRHPPKLEAFEGYSFVILKELSEAPAGFDFETTQLSVFVGDRFLLSQHPGRSIGVDAQWQKIHAQPELFSQGPDALALELFRTIIDRYMKLLLDLEPRLEQLELDILRNPSDRILGELLNYKTELKQFRRAFIYHEQIFGELKSNPYPAFRAELHHQMFDIHEHQARACSLTLLYYELASDLIDGYISVASHRLNQIMKVLTVVMSIFVPLSFLAGIYGMNFEYMPELNSRSGYFILLGVMSTIAVTLLVLFRRKHWL